MITPRDEVILVGIGRLIKKLSVLNNRPWDL
jgi:hypothetical protein